MVSFELCNEFFMINQGKGSSPLISVFPRTLVGSERRFGRNSILFVNHWWKKILVKERNPSIHHQNGGTKTFSRHFWSASCCLDKFDLIELDLIYNWMWEWFDGKTKKSFTIFTTLPLCFHSSAKCSYFTTRRIIVVSMTNSKRMAASIFHQFSLCIREVKATRCQAAENFVMDHLKVKVVKGNFVVWCRAQSTRFGASSQAFWVAKNFLRWSWVVEFHMRWLLCFVVLCTQYEEIFIYLKQQHWEYENLYMWKNEKFRCEHTREIVSIYFFRWINFVILFMFFFLLFKLRYTGSSAENCHEGKAA